jgi:hypothetical protein
MTRLESLNNNLLAESKTLFKQTTKKETKLLKCSAKCTGVLIEFNMHYCEQVDMHKIISANKQNTKFIYDVDYVDFLTYISALKIHMVLESSKTKIREQEWIQTFQKAFYAIFDMFDMNLDTFPPTFQTICSSLDCIGELYLKNDKAHVLPLYNLLKSGKNIDALLPIFNPAVDCSGSFVEFYEELSGLYSGSIAEKVLSRFNITEWHKHSSLEDEIKLAEILLNLYQKTPLAESLHVKSLIELIQCNADNLVLPLITSCIKRALKGQNTLKAAIASLQSPTAKFSNTNEVIGHIWTILGSNTNDLINIQQLDQEMRQDLQILLEIICSNALSAQESDSIFWDQIVELFLRLIGCSMMNGIIRVSKSPDPMIALVFRALLNLAKVRHAHNRMYCLSNHRPEPLIILDLYFKLLQFRFEDSDLASFHEVCGNIDWTDLSWSGLNFAVLNNLLEANLISKLSLKFLAKLLLLGCWTVLLDSERLQIESRLLECCQVGLFFAINIDEYLEDNSDR